MDSVEKMDDLDAPIVCGEEEREDMEMEVDVDSLMRTLTRKVVMWTLYIVDTSDMVNTVYIVYSVVSWIGSNSLTL